MKTLTSGDGRRAARGPRDGTRGRRVRGHTIIEVALASTVMVILVGGTYTAIKNAGDSWGSVVQRTQVQAKSRDTLRQITDDLKRAANIKIDGSDYHADALRLQLPVAFTDGAVQWGVRVRDPKTGLITPKPGYWLEYRAVVRYFDGVLTRRLVRRVLTDTLYRAVPDVTVADNVDICRNGAKGFAVIRTGDLYEVRLRLLKIMGKPTSEMLVSGDLTNVGTISKVELRSTVLTRNWSAEDTGATVETYLNEPETPTQLQ
jgi:hypothetical protein